MTAHPLQRVEGALVSRVFVKPADKTNLEVFRSYQRELKVIITASSAASVEGTFSFAARVVKGDQVSVSGSFTSAAKE